MNDLSAGKEAGNGLSVVNQWNHEQLRPFEYIVTSELLEQDAQSSEDCSCQPSSTSSTSSCSTTTSSSTAFRPCADAFEVFYAGPQKKWALRTRRQFAEDSVLFEYAGQLREDRDEPVEEDDYLFSFDYQGRRFLLDANRKGNMARFVCHSCSPNCHTRLLDADDEKGVPHLMICARRKIVAGEELTLDYGVAWWLAKRAEGVVCHCGHVLCRYDAMQTDVDDDSEQI